MSKIEAGIDESDKDILVGTIDTLRKIRTVASPGDSRFQFNSKPYPEVPIGNAQGLAVAAGNYLALRATNLDNGRQEREEWQDILSDVSRFYAQEKGTSFTRNDPSGAALSVYKTVNQLTVCTDVSLGWMFSAKNNFGYNAINRLLDSFVGVVAPLSGDYLQATFYRAYFALTRDRTFPLKLAVPSAKLRRVLLQRGNLGKPFDEIEEIGIFLDIVETGETGRSVYNSLKKEYPDKLIYQQQMDARQS